LHQPFTGIFKSEKWQLINCLCGIKGNVAIKVFKKSLETFPLTSLLARRCLLFLPRAGRGRIGMKM
jgi:hypothetical protein